MTQLFETSCAVSLIGIGNILMKDEGVGVHAVRYIQQHYVIPPGLEIIDGGTTGLDLLPYIENRDRVLFADTVNFHQAPGTIRVLKNKEIPAHFAMKDCLHHMGLMDVLAAAQLLDILPKDIRLIGIQPQRIEMGLELSDTIQALLMPFVAKILSEIGLPELSRPANPQ
jgi:hydrogenase maturation protease